MGHQPPPVATELALGSKVSVDPHRHLRGMGKAQIVARPEKDVQLGAGQQLGARTGCYRRHLGGRGAWREMRSLGMPWRCRKLAALSQQDCGFTPHSWSGNESVPSTGGNRWTYPLPRYFLKYPALVE